MDIRKLHAHHVKKVSAMPGIAVCGAEKHEWRVLTKTSTYGCFSQKRIFGLRFTDALQRTGNDEICLSIPKSARSPEVMARRRPLRTSATITFSVAQFEFVLGLRTTLRRKIVIQPFSVIRLRPRAVVAINP